MNKNSSINKKKIFHIGLVHYPVVERRGNVITSAVTNLDIHDMARLVTTYNFGNLYIITPIKNQQDLVERVMEHWINGSGATTNPHRKEAFLRIKIAPSIEDAKNHIYSLHDEKPITIATTAKKLQNQIKWKNLYGHILNDMVNIYILLFGTAHGLSPEVISEADYVLEPIKGYGVYNHLSVRCAAAIIVDRIYNILNKSQEEEKRDEQD